MKLEVINIKNTNRAEPFSKIIVTELFIYILVNTVI